MIRCYFEDKGCQFMAHTENFGDTLDCWHTRSAVPFAVRAGCIPHQIGTEPTTCNHAELAALNCDLDWLGHDDPCIHILDSNAIAFAARSVRDDPCPSMRRRVPDTGIAAGKGDMEGLLRTMDNWRVSTLNVTSNPWNEQQFIHLHLYPNE